MPVNPALIKKRVTLLEEENRRLQAHNTTLDNRVNALLQKIETFDHSGKFMHLEDQLELALDDLHKLQCEHDQLKYAYSDMIENLDRICDILNVPPYQTLLEWAQAHANEER